MWIFSSMDPKKLKDLLAQGGKKGGRLGMGLMALAGAAIGIQQSFYTGDISLKDLIYHKIRFSKNLMQPSKIKKKNCIIMYLFRVYNCRF